MVELNFSGIPYLLGSTFSWRQLNTTKPWLSHLTQIEEISVIFHYNLGS